ncbi:MAG: hypothetical protein QXU88_00630 [Candidatus Woesearchaeota archaeon]
MPKTTTTIEDLIRSKLAEIKRLPPEEKIKAVKELEAELARLEEERKAQIAEAVAIGTKALSEIEELRRLIPQAKAVSIEELFTRTPEKSEEPVESIGEQMAEKETPETSSKESLEEVAGAGVEKKSEEKAKAIIYSKTFEELKSDFYKLIEPATAEKIEKIKEMVLRGESLGFEEQVAFERYFHAFESFAPMTSYVSRNSKERFLSEKEELKVVAQYLGHPGGELSNQKVAKHRH